MYYRDNVHLLEAADGPCTIHRDFRPGNVIVNQGKIEGIIDWSSARGGFAQQDFCSMEHGVWSIDPKSKASFLSGYASLRPVPDYSSMMPLLRMSQALAVIGFMVKRGIYEGKHASLYQANRYFLETFFKSSA